MRRADYQPSPDSRKCLGVLIYRQRRFLLLSTALPVLDSAQQKALRFNRSGELFCMFGIWCSAQVPQTGGGEGGTQKRPHSVLTVVHEVGLGLLDIEVNGIGGAVGNVEVLPRVLMAGLRAVLFARHPDGKAGVIEPEAVERAGEAQLF